MEDSESESVFESLNLSPQLFINEVLNTLDDLVDDAFHYYLLQASSGLRTEDTDRSQELKKGVAMIQNAIESVLNKRLSMWEEYCLNHCFEVPEGFSLPENDELSGYGSACQDAIHDPKLDAELCSLRSKLTLVGKDSAALNRELRALEQQSVASGHCAALITEALKLYDKNTFDMMFQEMESTVSELRMKMGKLKKRRTEDTDSINLERPHSLHENSASMDYRKGFADANLEDLQGLLAIMKKV